LGIPARAEPEGARLEDGGIHRPELLRDRRAELHLGQHVPLEIAAGRELEELHALGAEPENGALRDVAHRLPAGGGPCPTDSDRRAALPNFGAFPRPRAGGAPPPGGRAPPLPKQPAKAAARGFGGDVNNPAAAWQARAELADVDVPRRVD